MEEQNQVQDEAIETEEEMDLPDNFFGDDDETAEVEAESTPAEEETETDESNVEDVKDETKSTEDTQNAQENVPFLKIRYNKEDKDLTQEEAITLAQKGMNYDHLNDKYTALNNELTSLAKASGMSVEDYIKGLKDVQKDFELNKEIELIKAQYPESSDELIKKLAQKNIDDRHAEDSKKEINESEAQSKKAEINRQIDLFSKRYPNADPAKLEQKVYDLMKEGYTLTEAYESVEADKLRSQLESMKNKAKANELNEKNKRKSLGNTHNVGAIEGDDFLSAFMSD